MKVIFMGTPEFGVPTLEAVLANEHEVCAVYTQPDKPKGRGYVMTPPPVKECALKYSIPVFQPKTMKDGEAEQQIRDFMPDVIVVVAYGKILPQAILDIPKYGCLNVHASLLPQYRGAAPIQWAVINGEEKSGVTIMQMDAGLDTGDMLMKTEVGIGPDETAGELHDKLCIAGADLLIDALNCLEKGMLKKEKQPDTDTCYASMLNKEMCVLDWRCNAQDLHNKIRGLSPWPAAVSALGGKRIKIHRSALAGTAKGKCGEILSVSPFIVACGEGTALRILTIQAEGGKKLDIEAFLRGHKIDIGTIFGE